MEQAKCINGFSVEKCDDDGFQLDDAYETVEEGSIWDIEEDSFRIIGGQIRLTNDEGVWLELPKEHFETDFEIIN